ncbi:ATP-binding cassette domain-containing protein [Leifsonia kafniensis]|uniref:ATP-binding cassette domain-containing protein n=1 Tax=Leifsonia kafniensis TaxID=475957 RepID=A0ABP7K9U4_9MICO
MSTVLDAQLVVRRGEFILDAAIRIESGEVLALLGPNGAGKSTLLAAVAGLILPDAGSVSVAGRLLTRVSEGARRVAVVPERRAVGLLGQEALLFPHLDARDNVAFGQRAQGQTRSAARLEAVEWLAAVGLEGLEERKPAELSGGQQQRVALARALAARPDLLLLDEPMAALDVQTAARMRQLLRERLAERTIATLLVTHDVLDAIVLADRIAILHDGKIVDAGPTARVLAEPRNQFTAALAGINLLNGVAEPPGVRLPDGRYFVGSADARVFPAAGAEVALVFRPAAVSVYRTEPHPFESDGQHTNYWEATIVSLESGIGGVRIRVAEDPHLVVELAPAKVVELGLRAGVHVWLSVAAADVVLLPR